MSDSILVVGPAWVGDMVMAQSLFKVLKLEQPHVSIDVLAPSWSVGLLSRMPEVRSLIPHSLGHGQWVFKQRRHLAQKISALHYQQAIVLPNSWKSALIPFLAKIPQRTGYVGELRFGLLNDIRRLGKLSKTVEQFAALGLSAQDSRKGELVPRPRLLPGNVEQAFQRLHLTWYSRPLLILCPGAEYGLAKQWPLEYYAVVAKHQSAQGWQVWLLGSEKDVQTGAQIAHLVGKNCLNLCGQTTLQEVVDLMSIAQAVITNDSGLMHVAAALDKPLIAIYGSSDPLKTPPLSDEARIISLYLKCSPCFQRICPLKHSNCLRDIKPEQVLETLTLLEKHFS